MKTGTYLVKCPDGRGGYRVRPVTFSRSDIAHYASEGNAMLAAGLQIPIPKEHQDVLPLSTAERNANSVEHNAGWVKRYERDANSLYAVLGIEDPGLAAKLPQTIKYVSPEITPEFVGAGKVWRNVITHVALTPQPVQFDQEPFGADGASLTPTTPATVQAAGNALRWSQAVNSFAHTDRIRFSMADLAGQASGRWIRLSKGDAMADEKSKVPEPDGDEAGKIDDETPDSPPEALADTEGDGAGGDAQFIDQAKAIAAKLGIVLPEHTDASNFLEHFSVAGTALIHRDKQDAAGDMGQGNGQGMGQGNMQPREEPQMGTMQMSAKQWQGRAEKAEKELADARFQNLSTDIDGLLAKRRVNAETAVAWKNKLGAKRMSLAGGSDATTAKILAQIEFAKQLPEGTYGPTGRKAVRLSTSNDDAVEEAIPANARWEDDAPEDREEMITRLSNRGKNGTK